MTSIHCNRCSALVPENEFNQPDLHECSGCGNRIKVHVFPAYYRKPGPVRAEAAAEGESSCYFHPHKQAILPCDECGRFLCTLCRVEFGNRIVCPGCITGGLENKKLPALQTTRRRYDSIALGVAIFPTIAIWPTLFSAPIAIYLCVRHWNDPKGLLPRSRVRLILALLIALTQLAAWAVIILSVFYRLQGQR